MTKPSLHPWLSTSDAVRAAHTAVRIAERKMPRAAQAAGSDELFAEALIVLTECALPLRERGHLACAECGGSLAEVRAGAKFCKPACANKNAVKRHRAGKQEAPPAPPKGHVGSMHSWPEGKRPEYAAREVGYALCNWLRTRPRETAVSGETLDRAQVLQGDERGQEGDAYHALMDRGYELALEAFEATGVIPFDLLDDAQFAVAIGRCHAVARRELTLCAA